MWWFLIPLIVLGVLLLLFGVLILLGRYKNGALLRPIIAWLSKFGFMRRLFTRVSTAALERQNPELAGTPAERRAYFEATEAQSADAPNRQARRRVERMQQQARSTRPGSSSKKRKRR